MAVTPVEAPMFRELDRVRVTFDLDFEGCVGEITGWHYGFAGSPVFHVWLDDRAGLVTFLADQLESENADA